MRRIDFYKLTREKQERFLASAKGSAPPAPIVEAKGDGGLSLIWGGGAVAAAIAIAILYGFRYGVLGAPLAVQSFGWLLVYAGLFFALPYAALRAVGYLLGSKLMPYRPGIYVFPMCLVDARDKLLRIHAMTDIASVDKATATTPLKLSFRGGRSFKFSAQDVHEAEMLNRSVENAQEQVKHALSTSDDSELVTLDPFYDAKRGWTSPIGPKEALVDRAPVWHKRNWALAAACALVLGPVLWVVHNHSSDDAMLKKAVAAATPEAYQSYLNVGKRHTDEVSNTLLPRAELQRAKAKETVDAIQSFIAAHPHTSIDGEAQTALRDAYLRELDKAKKAASLAALASFDSVYPNNHLGAELKAAKHQLYVDAIERFKTIAARDDAQLLAFVTRLAKWLEANGPAALMVFHREVSPGLAAADKLLVSLHMNRAFGPTQVTKYFDPDAKEPKEANVAAAFDKALKRIFSPDLIDVQVAQAEDPSKALVVVRYHYGWVGGVLVSGPMKRLFAPITTSGDSVFSLPDQAAPLKTRIDVPPEGKLLLDYTATHDGLDAPAVDENNPEPGVYIVQEMRALDHIATLLERAIVKPVAK